MKFITVDTNNSPKLERLSRSCRHFGIPLEVIGAGRPYPYHGVKIQYILEYLDEQDADATVMFVDGYDVVFLCGADEIDAKFKSFDHPLVISTEQNCNVDGGLHIRFPTWWNYPKGKKPYRFINTGSIVGKAGFMREFLRRLEIQPTDCEQTIMNRHFTRCQRDLALDYDQQIFTCTAGRTGLEETDYRVENGRLRNTLTGSLPCVLHCPGKNYIGLEKLVARLPFAGPAYAAAPAERRHYRQRQIVNWLTARLLPDNFIFHLVVDALLVVLAVAVVLGLLYLIV